MFKWRIKRALTSDFLVVLWYFDDNNLRRRDATAAKMYIIFIPINSDEYNVLFRSPAPFMALIYYLQCAGWFHGNHLVIHRLKRCKIDPSLRPDPLNSFVHTSHMNTECVWNSKTSLTSWPVCLSAHTANQPSRNQAMECNECWFQSLIYRDD